MKPYYDSGGVTIYHGECADVLPHLPESELMLTDPPYELTAKGGGIGNRREYMHKIEGFTDSGFDLSTLDACKSWICFCAKEQLLELLTKAASMPRWMLVTWNKPNPTPLCNGNYLPDTEYIVHGFQPNRCFGRYRDKSRFIVHPAQQSNWHPNEKPVTVLAKMIAVGSEEGDTIVDPYMGSGSTLVAARLEGRKAIGIEREEKYCAKAVERLRQNCLPGFGGMDADEMSSHDVPNQPKLISETTMVSRRLRPDVAPQNQTDTA